MFKLGDKVIYKGTLYTKNSNKIGTIVHISYGIKTPYFKINVPDTKHYYFDIYATESEIELCINNKPLIEDIIND